nr:uncharacterized protein LOC113811708 isoform X1 [Penaeus vannamei]
MTVLGVEEYPATFVFVAWRGPCPPECSQALPPEIYPSLWLRPPPWAWRCQGVSYRCPSRPRLYRLRSLVPPWWFRWARPRPSSPRRRSRKLRRLPASPSPAPRRTSLKGIARAGVAPSDTAGHCHDLPGGWCPVPLARSPQDSYVVRRPWSVLAAP